MIQLAQAHYIARIFLSPIQVNGRLEHTATLLIKRLLLSHAKAVNKDFAYMLFVEVKLGLFCINMIESARKNIDFMLSDELMMDHAALSDRICLTPFNEEAYA